MALANFRIKMCLAGLALSFFYLATANSKIGLEFFGIELVIGGLRILFCRQRVEFLVQIPLIKIYGSLSLNFRCLKSETSLKKLNLFKLNK